MRALRFHAAGDLRLEQVDDPPRPDAGEVLVAPVVCGICGTDVHEYQAGPRSVPVQPHPLTGARAPQILGHELAGEVLATGPDVRSVAPGDRVAVMPLLACGRCVPCVRGHAQHCAHRAAVGLSHPWGGMADLAILAERQLTRLPDAVSWEQGALVEPLAVAAAALGAGGMRRGETVLITGAGPIGALAAVAARADGAGDVLVSEPSPDRRRLIAALGFDVVDPLATDVAAACRERRAGGVDLAVECSGQPAALEAALAAVARGGRVVQAGVIEQPVTLSARRLTLRGLSLVGSVGYPFDVWPGLLERIAAGALPVDGVVTRRVALERAVPDGFERLAGGGPDIKVLVDLRGDAQSAAAASPARRPKTSAGPSVPPAPG